MEQSKKPKEIKLKKRGPYKKRKNKSDEILKPVEEVKQVIEASTPGKTERSLMFIAKILSFALRFIERRISSIKSRRLADRMNRS